ncbi:hypothetical protein BH11BAC3_BH11BAC3_44160 [soil metagenome]
MIWEKINNDHSTLQEYRLSDNTDNQLVLKYNPLHHSVRVTFGNIHRLFFLESAGSMSGKTIFRNEYGLETGSMSYQHSSNNKGALQIDTKQYQFQLKNDQLTIYSDQQQPLANCEFKNHTLSSKSINNIDMSCYLLGVCWYLFLPFTQRVFRYAEAS